MGRADGGEFAGRVNAAVELMASGATVAEVARVLAGRFGVSVRRWPITCVGAAGDRQRR